MDKPIKLDEFMYMVMKEARRRSLTDLLEDRGITEEEYMNIVVWFEKNLDIQI